MVERVEPQGEEALRAEIVRLGKVVKALMNRAEQAMNAQTSSFGMFRPQSGALKIVARTSSPPISASMARSVAAISALMSASVIRRSC